MFSSLPLSYFITINITSFIIIITINITIIIVIVLVTIVYIIKTAMLLPLPL